MGGAVLSISDRRDKHCLACFLSVFTFLILNRRMMVARMSGGFSGLILLLDAEVQTRFFEKRRGISKRNYWKRSGLRAARSLRRPDWE